MVERSIDALPEPFRLVFVARFVEAHLFNEFVRDGDLKRKAIETIMQPAFPFVDISTPVELLATMITPENPAVLVRDFKTEKTFIITRSDIIRVLA